MFSGSSVKAEKRKHISLSITQKVELLKKLEKGTSVPNLCKEYNIGKSTIYDLKKNKSELFKYFAEADSPLGMQDRKRMRTAQHEELDKVMIEWFRQRRMEGIPLTGLMVMEKAKMFHRNMNISTACEYSTGWLRSFKKRHGIRQLTICGERASADYESAESFVDEFAEIVNKENLSAEQIYNADETALFWRYLPNKSLCAADETAPPGIKHAKDRITVLACANAAGTHKLKLLVVGKFSKPQSKNAWVTKDWFKNIFVPQSRSHCTSVGLPKDAKILLILDNCSAHPPAAELETENVIVQFLPPNCTSILQPMDMGVLRALKCAYKTDFVKELLRFVDSQNDATSVADFVKHFSIKDAMWNAAKEWEKISCETLKNAWHNLWPQSLFLDDEENGEEFEEFRTKNTVIAELLQYAKENCNNKVPLETSDIEEIMYADDDAPITNQLTDGEIMDIVLSQPQQSDDDCSVGNKKIPTDELITIMDSAIAGLEQRDFINELEIMTLRKIKDKLLAEKPKLLKQKKLTDMF